MKKTIYLALAFVASIAAAQAGGYLTNTNQHISFLRNPARNATTSIDALYSNPAGAAFFKEGWQLSINLQSAYQNRNIEATFPTFAANADGRSTKGTRLFEGVAKAPIIPSLFVAYKTNKWTFGLNTAVIGGGGSGKFTYGLPTFEAPISVLPTALSRAGIAASKYQYESFVEGKQYIYGATLGAAYRVNERLSVYAGVRAAYASNGYYGYARNIQADLNGGAMQSISAALTAKATQATAGAAQAAANNNADLATQLTAQAKQLGTYAALTADKGLEVKQSGFGIAPILGINYKIGALHLAAKYEFGTNIKVKNSSKSNSTGITEFNDGLEQDNDIPALLSLGMSYSLLPSLRLSAGYHHYFDKQADMANAKQKQLDGNTNEYLLGIEYDLNERLTLSAGGQLTAYGQSDAFQSDLSFHNDSYSLGFGLAYKLNRAMTLNAAYFFTNYQDYSKSTTPYTTLAPTLKGTNVYKRSNQVFGLGIDLAL